MANRRFIDFPIAASVGDNDIVLIWQDGLNKQTTKATLFAGSPNSLAGLTDVDISALTNGQILQYNSTTSKWENVDRTDIDLDQLGDVTIVSPTNGQVLVYNSSTSKWENSSAGFVPYTGAVTTVNLGAQSILAGSFVKAGGTSAQFLKADGSVDSTAYGTGSVTSVALTMPSAFSVANSPITTAGTLAVSGAGTVAQYVRGDGSLADFPATTGGGSSVSYYLNGSVNQGTFGGTTYYEVNRTPVLGAGTDFTINADGYIASFITDAMDPNQLVIPSGNWNFETYFQASSGGGSPTFYVELYKVSGTTFTLIASNSGSPELIAFGTNLAPYFSTLAVPQTTLALTDRLAIRYYVVHSGRTITLHTENNTLCQIITTFTTGLTALNGLTTQVQFFAVGTSGTNFNIASATDTHTFNLPTASATNRGALSSADWALFTQAYNDKINSASVTGTTTKTLTLTQQDGGTITASWTDLNTDAVISVFGRTGAVVAANGDYTTAQVTESGNLYFTQARVSANTDVAANTAARHNAVTLGTANGLSLSTQVLSLGLASAGVTGALSGTDWSTFNAKANANGSNATGTWGISITGDAGSVDGIDSSRIVYGGLGARQGVTEITNWNQTTFPNAAFLSAEQNTPNAPTTDFSYGVQTSFHRDAPEYRTQFVTSLYGNNVYWLRQFRDSAAWSSWVQVIHSGNFNSYSPTLTGGGASGNWPIDITGNAGTVTNGVYTSRTITINGTTQDLSANRTFNVGTVTSVTASSPLFSSGGTTPNITIQQASGSQNGFLSSTDWTTFNNKANSVAGGYLPLSGGTMTGPLTISGLNYGNTLVITTSNINGADIRLTNTGSGGKAYSITSTGSNNAIGAGGLQFYNETDGVVAFGYTSSRNFLINTSTDAGFRLDVNGTGRFTSNLYISGGTNTNVGNGIHAYYESNFAQVQLNGVTGSLIDFSTSGTDFLGRIIYINSTNSMQFHTASSGTAALTINSLGAASFSSSVTATRLSLNNTGTAARLQVNGVNSEPIAYLYNNSGTAGSVPGVAIEAGTNSSDYALSVASSLGTTYLRVRGDGNVGIGPATASRRLTISEGTGSLTNAYMSFNNSAERWVIGNEGGLGTGTNDFFFFDGGYRMVIKQGGNVLIGTTTDNGYRINNTGNIWSNGVRIGRDFSIANRATVRLDSNGDNPADILFGRTAAALETSWTGVFWGISSRGSGENNEFRIYRGGANTGGSESVVLSINPGTENVMIGTTSDDGQRLQVSGNLSSTGDILVKGTYNPYTATNRGNITLNGTSSNILGFANNTTTRGYILHDGTDIEIVNQSSGVIHFFTSSGEAMRINSGLSILTYSSLNVGGSLDAFTIRTLAPTGSNTEIWRLGRALLATSSVPEDRWIRVQLGNRIYDILAIDRGAA